MSVSAVTTLIIARHGNTFAADETPRRVGARTDLPLVQSGREQARKLGVYLRDHNLTPARIVTSELQRTRQTAELAAAAFDGAIPSRTEPAFNEIDYGPDENQTEDFVKARIGEGALTLWEHDGILPAGWSPSAEVIRSAWFEFAAGLADGETTLVVTSNGIARFALHLTGQWDHYRTREGLKLSTGALGVLTRRKGEPVWSLAGWNIRP